MKEIKDTKQCSGCPVCKITLISEADLNSNTGNNAMPNNKYGGQYVIVHDNEKITQIYIVNSFGIVQELKCNRNYYTKLIEQLNNRKSVLSKSTIKLSHYEIENLFGADEYKRKMDKLKEYMEFKKTEKNIKFQFIKERINFGNNEPPKYVYSNDRMLKKFINNKVVNSKLILAQVKINLKDIQEFIKNVDDPQIGFLVQEACYIISNLSTPIKQPDESLVNVPFGIHSDEIVLSTPAEYTLNWIEQNLNSQNCISLEYAINAIYLCHMSHKSVETNYKLITEAFNYLYIAKLDTSVARKLTLQYQDHTNGKKSQESNNKVKECIINKANDYRNTYPNKKNSDVIGHLLKNEFFPTCKKFNAAYGRNKEGIYYTWETFEEKYFPDNLSGRSQQSLYKLINKWINNIKK